MKAHVRSTEGTVLVWAVSKGFESFKADHAQNGGKKPIDRVLQLLTRALDAKANINLSVRSGRIWDTQRNESDSPALHVAAAQPLLFKATQLLLERGADVNAFATQVYEFLDTPQRVEASLQSLCEILIHEPVQHGDELRYLDFAKMLPLALPFALAHRKTVRLLLDSAAPANLLRWEPSQTDPCWLNVLHLVS